MSRLLNTTVAAGALIAMLAAPVLAQDAAPAPDAPQTTPQTMTDAAAPVDAPVDASEQITLPAILRDAGLVDVETRPARHGTRLEGKLADGTQLQAMLDDAGALRGVRARDAALPQNLIAQLVPQAVRDAAIFGELGRIDAVFTGDRGIMVAGKDAQDRPVRAAFSEDGTLLRFGRGDEGGPGMREHGPDHGPGDGPGDGPDKGPRQGKDKRDSRGPDGHPHDGPGKHRHSDRGDDGGTRGKGPKHDRGPRADAGAPPTAPDADQVRAALTEAGYSSVGQILQQGPITVAQATNPEGEPVLVEIGVDGAVLRELNR